MLKYYHKEVFYLGVLTMSDNPHIHTEDELRGIVYSAMERSTPFTYLFCVMSLCDRMNLKKD